MLLIQKPTSIRQKLLAGWQGFWRDGVSGSLTMRRRPDILELFNQGQPHAKPVEILPISHVFNLEQSQQSVDPVHTITLAPKDPGERGVSTAGKEKEREFCCVFDCKKFPQAPCIVFQAISKMFPEHGQMLSLSIGTVALQLVERQ